jgi:hypothetical protein
MTPPPLPSAEWHWEQGLKFATEAMKTSLLLNGAAAIALMTFANTHSLPDGIKWALLLFATGAAVTGFGFLILASHMTQLRRGIEEVPLERGQIWTKAAALLVTASIVSFAVGCIVVMLSWPTASVLSCAPT